MYGFGQKMNMQLNRVSKFGLNTGFAENCQFTNKKGIEKATQNFTEI